MQLRSLQRTWWTSCTLIVCFLVGASLSHAKKPSWTKKDYQREKAKVARQVQLAVRKDKTLRILRGALSSITRRLRRGVCQKVKRACKSVCIKFKTKTRWKKKCVLYNPFTKKCKKRKRVPVGVRKTCTRRKRVCAPAPKPFCVRRSRGKLKLFRSGKLIPRVVGSLKRTFRTLRRKFQRFERVASGQIRTLKRKIAARTKAVAQKARKKFGRLLREIKAYLEKHFPVWKLKVMALAAKNLRREMARARRLADKARRSTSFRSWKRRQRTLVRYARKHGGTAKRRFLGTARRFKAIVKARKGRAFSLIKKIMLRVAQKRIDRTLRGYVQELSRHLGVSSVLAARKQRASQQRRAALQRATNGSNASSRSEGNTVYERDGISFSLVLAIGGGGFAGIDGALGVVWDDRGTVRGMATVSYLGGLVGKVDLDMVYMVHPGRLDFVEGMSMSLTGSGAYYGGANVALEWNIPFVQPVPSWGFGVTAGMGGGLAVGLGGTSLFPSLPKNYNQSTNAAKRRARSQRKPSGRRPPRQRDSRDPCRNLSGVWTRVYKVRGRTQRNQIKLRLMKGVTYQGRYIGALARNKSRFTARCIKGRLTLKQRSGRYRSIFRGVWRGSRWVGRWMDSSRNRGIMTLSR